MVGGMDLMVIEWILLITKRANVAFKYLFNAVATLKL